MTNEEMARSYLQEAGEILVEAEGMYRRGVWNLAVRRSQEVVELSLKSALRLAGIEVPRIHDVGMLLKDHREKFTLEFRGEIDRLASISRRLRREREISLYGDEETGASPQRLYTEPDGRAALDDAGLVLSACQGLMNASMEQAGA